MRFLLSLPLPLLLILISPVSFDSQAVPPDVFNPREPAHPRFNRSANDPIAQVAGAVSNNTIPPEYLKMSADQLKSEKKVEEAKVNELRANREKAHDALNKQEALDVVPKKDYLDKKTAWETMSQRYEEMKEGKRKEQNATAEFVAAEAHFNKTQNEVDTAADELQTLQTELSKLKGHRDKIKNMPKRKIEAESEKTEANIIKPGLVTEEGRLRGVKEAKFKILDELKKTIADLEEYIKNNNCVANPTSKCTASASSITRLTGDLPAANTAFNTAEDEWERVKDKLDECTNKLDALETELREIYRILPKHAGKLKDAQALVDIKSKDEGPMNETLANAEKARDLAQEELTKKETAKIKVEEDAAAAPVDLTAAETKARNAKIEFTNAETTWKTLTTAEDQLRKKLQDIDDSFAAAEERVGQLEQEYQKKLKNNPATGGSPLKWILAVLGVILFLALIAVIAFFVKRRMTKQKKEPAATATSHATPTPTPEANTPNDNEDLHLPVIPEENMPFKPALEKEVALKDVKDDIRKIVLVSIKENTMLRERNGTYLFTTKDGLRRRIFAGGQGSEVIAGGRIEYYDINDPARPWLNENAKMVINNSIISRVQVFLGTKKNRHTAEELIERTKILKRVEAGMTEIKRKYGGNLDASGLYIVLPDGSKYTKEGVPMPDEEKIQERILEMQKKGGFEITRDELLAFAKDTFEKFRRGEKQVFNSQRMMGIILQAMEVFKNESKLLIVEGDACIVGDVHGQMDNLDDFFKMVGGMSTDKWEQFIFLGDYVDRGKNSTELIMVLLSLKICFPKKFNMLRGNHETISINFRYGLRSDLVREYGKEMGHVLWEFINFMFCEMPLAAINEIKKKTILCMHGGIPEHLTSRKQLEDIPSKWDPTEHKIACSLCWADPSWDTEDFKDGRRGVCKCFGRKAIEAVCKNLQVDLIVRAHQKMFNGVEVHGPQLISIFSASDYDGEEMVPNSAALLRNTKAEGLIAMVLNTTGQSKKEIRMEFNISHYYTSFHGDIKAAITDKDETMIGLPDEEKNSMENKKRSHAKKA